MKKKKVEKLIEGVQLYYEGLLRAKDGNIEKLREANLAYSREIDARNLSIIDKDKELAELKTLDGPYRYQYFVLLEDHRGTLLNLSQANAVCDELLAELNNRNSRVADQGKRISELEAALENAMSAIGEVGHHIGWMPGEDIREVAEDFAIKLYNTETDLALKTEIIAKLRETVIRLTGMAEGCGKQ